MRALLAAAALAAAAAVLPAVPAAAAPGSCVAVTTAAPSCSYSSGGGYVTLRCAATSCLVWIGSYADSCYRGCTRVYWAGYGQRVVLTVKGAGLGAIAGS